MHEVTRILTALEQGDPQAAEQLLPLVYDELRKLAAARLARENPGQTLDATALVHEAYLRLVGGQISVGNGQESEVSGQGSLAPGSFDHRGHFFAAAAQAMRRILIDNARRKARHRHGGQHERVPLDDVPQSAADDQLLALDEALSGLAAEDPQAAQVIELHHFAGLSHEQVAAALEMTVYRARQKWTYARAWLQDALEKH